MSTLKFVTRGCLSWSLLDCTCSARFVSALSLIDPVPPWCPSRNFIPRRVYQVTLFKKSGRKWLFPKWWESLSPQSIWQCMSRTGNRKHPQVTLGPVCKMAVQQPFFVQLPMGAVNVRLCVASEGGKSQTCKIIISRGQFKTLKFVSVAVGRLLQQLVSTFYITAAQHLREERVKLGVR